MAYDEGLAQRLREHFEDEFYVEEKKMFGGLCFMLSGHMCCGIIKDTLMARVGQDNYEASLAHPSAAEMDFTGKPMKGLVYIRPEGFESDEALAYWVDICAGFVKRLPLKI